MRSPLTVKELRSLAVSSHIIQYQWKSILKTLKLWASSHMLILCLLVTHTATLFECSCFLGRCCSLWLKLLLLGKRSNLASLYTLWFEQQVPVIFGCFVAGRCVFKYLLWCVCVCFCKGVCTNVCVLMCVLPCYLCIFTGTEIHSRKLRQVGANKALWFAELPTHGMLSSCLPTLLKVLDFFWRKNMVI